MRPTKKHLTLIKIVTLNVVDAPAVWFVMNPCIEHENKNRDVRRGDAGGAMGIVKRGVWNALFYF